MTTAILPRSTVKICSIPDCESLVMARGWCTMHYSRFLRGQEMLAPARRVVNDPEKRFWAKVNKDGPTMPHMETACWVWTARTTIDGYGSFRYGQVVNAHRYSFFLANGHWPEPQGLHACDNPPCVNPDHISEGDQKENAQQREDRGRGRQHQGSQNNFAILTEEDIPIIRYLLDRGALQQHIAACFRVTEAAIGNISVGRGWEHV